MPTSTRKKKAAPKLSNSEAWAQAAEEVRASWGDVGGFGTDATAGDLPEDDRAYWDAVEKRAVELGGNPAG